MKTIIIQSQLVLLTLVTFPTMFYTSTSDARISRGPAWVAAIDAVNNRRISPTTGVYDPNCDDAKVWDIKLVDKDGDGVPDEDRKKSGLKSAGYIVVGSEGNKRYGSTFTAGKRHVVTAGHLFARDGARRPGRDSEVTIQIEGCPGEVYRAKQVHLKTTDIPSDRASTEDYAVIELDREFCEEARPLPFGAPTDNSTLEIDVYATGYYKPNDINTPLAGNQNPKGGSTLGVEGGSGSNELQQFSSSGNIIKEGIVREQLMYQYRMGQAHGGSGGPLIAKVNGQVSVIGIQFYEAGEGLNFNFAIAAQGPFKEFVQSIVGPELALND